jgi:nucleoside-diphosphate kinase
MLRRAALRGLAAAAANAQATAGFAAAGPSRAAAYTTVVKVKPETVRMGLTAVAGGIVAVSALTASALAAASPAPPAPAPAAPAAAAAKAPASSPPAKVERTFIAVKPDGVERRLIAAIVDRFERRGYRLAAAKVIHPSPQLADEHYAEHRGKPFQPSLVEFLSSGPVFAMVWEGDGVIKSGRAMIGATNPQASAPGTIRGDYGIVTGRNIIHGSDGPESAEREIGLWFKPEEVVAFVPTDAKHSQSHGSGSRDASSGA